jgi:HSP20 family molecular chaperone IbpA
MHAQGLPLASKRRNVSRGRELSQDLKNGTESSLDLSPCLPALMPANVNATFEDGVLNITLPKREEFKPKQITISVNRGATTPGKPGKEKAA